ncbi:hypothetical protein Tco_1307579 [Tanacetum coccineum]
MITEFCQPGYVLIKLKQEENKIVEMSKSSFVDTTGEFISSIGTEDTQSRTKSDFSNVATKVLDVISKDPEVKEILEPLNEKTQYITSEFIESTTQLVRCHSQKVPSRQQKRLLPPSLYLAPHLVSYPLTPENMVPLA